MLGHHNMKAVLYDKHRPFALIFLVTSISKPQIKLIIEIVIKKQDLVLLAHSCANLVELWCNYFYFIVVEMN